MKTKWYCRFAEEPEGPFSSRQMRALAKQGRITAETPVRREADEKWYAARKVGGLLKRKKKRRASSAGEVAAAKPANAGVAEGEIVRAQLAEAAAPGVPPNVVVPPLAGGGGQAEVLPGLALSVPKRARITPAIRRQRMAERQLWIAGGLAACVVILAVLSGVLAYQVSKGNAGEAVAAAIPAPANPKDQPAASVAPGAAVNPMPVSPAPAAGAPAVENPPVAKVSGNPIISGQKKWTDLAELGDGLVSEGMVVQITKLWWASDAAGAPAGVASATEPGGAAKKSAASYLFLEVQVTNLNGTERKYKSWNSPDKDFAIAADQTNRTLGLVARAQTKGVARLAEAEVKPGQSVKDILVFTAPMTPAESVRVLLAKKAISEDGGYLAWEIAKDIWDAGEQKAAKEMASAAGPANGK